MLHLLQERKKIPYSLSQSKRDKLLGEIEGYNVKLRSYLSRHDNFAEDSVPGSRPERRRSVARQYRDLLSFSNHATRIFRLMAGTLTCGCSSSHCAHLWLQRISSPKTRLDVSLKYGEGSGAASQRSWDQQLLRAEFSEAISEEDCARFNQAASISIPTGNPASQNTDNHSWRVLHKTGACHVLTCNAQGCNRAISHHNSNADPSQERR